MFTLKYFKWNT